MSAGSALVGRGCWNVIILHHRYTRTSYPRDRGILCVLTGYAFIKVGELSHVKVSVVIPK